MAIIHNTSKSKTVNHSISTDDSGLFMVDFDCHNGHMPHRVDISLRPFDRRRNREWRSITIETVRRMHGVLEAVLDIDASARLQK
jgi:hypothetical protein